MNKETTATAPPARTAADSGRLAARASALWIARYGYEQAITSPNPAARLDDMCDAMTEVWDEITPKLPKRLAGKNLQFAESMRAATADRLWAFTVVEHAKADADPGYRWAYELLVDALKAGADPAVVRADVGRVTERLGQECTERAAVTA